MMKSGDRLRYNAYGSFLKEKFGCRVYKVSVDGGFTCPNRDGTIATGGCIYCNNASFRPPSADRISSVAAQIEAGVAYLRKRYRAEKFIAYFQPFTNTHAPLDVLAPLYETALSHHDVIGLSIGTRPDCIDEAKIAYLETGRQSFRDRGVRAAVHPRLHPETHQQGSRCSVLDQCDGAYPQPGIWLCTHLILGFPGSPASRCCRGGVSFRQRSEFPQAASPACDPGHRTCRMYHDRPFPLLSLEGTQI